ncbi:G-type lectin S-receptor-like serine/threonine-protein kinase At5g35370 [Mercurialis annua]|uniref:G-type lectin S-receptor-like serine/threonine-protein kinase At5g35370 n=1 Tax=Mercurialis annua TaxID=3986 RepID=UPI00215E28C0|nr:G-type lectin S-receptor-like serine/threonine-protein kinase At5g35370 [Mercurialis annua]
MKTLFSLTIIFLFCSLVSGAMFTEFLYPNFSASNFRFIDNQGTFLLSRNQTFKVSIFNPGEQSNFYLCVIHVTSHTIIWSANRNAPIPTSGNMELTPQGIHIYEGNTLKWSTPALKSSVQALQLTEMGNLVLLDQLNNSLWQSFDEPTDTIVIAQSLPQGKVLTSGVSDDNLSAGDYRLAITDSDAILQWRGQTYWRLSMETRANRNSNFIVEYMAMNSSGMFLFGRSGLAVVMQMSLSPSDFQIARLDPSGQFIISRLISGAKMEQEFVGPTDGCKIPLVCGKIGLCTENTSKRTSCSCPQGFQKHSSTCMPSDGSSFPQACNNLTKKGDISNNSSDISYIKLGYDMNYFSIQFSQPIRYSVNLSVCQGLCTSDCSCLGIFHENSSGSCYGIENDLGSIISTTALDDQNDLLGFIKVIASSASDGGNTSENEQFPVIAQILLPSTVFLVAVAFGFFWWRRRRISKKKVLKFGQVSSRSSIDLDSFHIPGLPQRFDYEELELATENFKTKIGSGGFGSVYKGIFPDKSIVAVKKLTNLGVQGKKDFCTEIAIIGSIHHVNLVKLRGFCAQGRQRLLVYEYMNRGSLDRTLFGNGPILEWQERFDIALGTARGLSYLHTGCDHKIIHCDVKPENILLHDHFQAKLSDFGLSKLLSPEESSLFTTMRGTRGYLAPEWLTNSAISEKTDVYSFGMVLLELVSGRKNCLTRSQSHSKDNSHSGGGSTSSLVSELSYFPLFALEMHEQGKYLELADPRLEGRVKREEVEKLVCIALCCVHEEPSLRPNMVSVVGMLEGGIAFVQPKVELLNFLRFYGRRFTEASMLEDGNEHSNIVLFPGASNSASSASDYQACFSYISSQEVSGPR